MTKLWGLRRRRRAVHRLQEESGGRAGLRETLEPQPVTQARQERDKELLSDKVVGGGETGANDGVGTEAAMSVKAHFQRQAATKTRCDNYPCH